MRYLVVLLLAGCATQPDFSWQKPGSTPHEFDMDSGQCRAQAFSIYGPMVQRVIVFESCLQGKGWYKVQEAH